VSQAGFVLQGRNPDVLTCIANLSNDEVFTPPELARQMLDAVADGWATQHGGSNIWADKSVRFLDPFTKSGVFLREITRRLVEGLAAELPDLTQRVNHVVSHQVYGIAITELTSLLARRSVYCSKYANGPHSIAHSVFGEPAGNIWYERTDHEWVTGRCVFCGANSSVLDRGAGMETHAYAFTHAADIGSRMAQIFGDNVHFDVIVGNPPYQLNDGGGAGSSAIPIYNKFIEQAKKLEPRLLCMVIPAKWYSGGKGLGNFRETMLSDKRIRHLTDFPDSRTAFSGVDVAGGVCFFLWDRDNSGECRVETVTSEGVTTAIRSLDEFQTFIRDNRALGIIHKIVSSGETGFAGLVSSRKPFGLESAEKGDAQGDVCLFAAGGDKRINRGRIPKGDGLIDRWKVLLSKTSSEHAGQTDRSGTKRVFSRVEVMAPGSVATESYLIVGPFGSRKEAENAAEYLRTKFVRWLVSTILLTQNISRSMFEFVPSQDFTLLWSDDVLFAKYGLDAIEIALVEQSIRSMESPSAQAD
jgi:hypothetical protein